MRLILCFLVCIASGARAAEITDATGRTMIVPDKLARVLPAGPPAAVLLLALAPDLMLGLPMDPSPEARALLPPAAAALPKVPRLTGKQDVTEQIRALKPDLIVDYGDIGGDYPALAQRTQERLGVPTLLLDGALANTPQAFRLLGAALHRQARGEELARVAEFWLAVADGPHRPPPHSVVYVRGSDALRAVAPDIGASEVFARLHWQVLAPPGDGAFRPVTRAQIAALDPDVLVFGDPKMGAAVAASPEWRALRAVREGHAFTDPALPFGWIEEPPSINRLFGLTWLTLSFGDTAKLNDAVGLLFADLYGQALPDDSSAQSKPVFNRLAPLAP